MGLGRREEELCGALVRAIGALPVSSTDADAGVNGAPTSGMAAVNGGEDGDKNGEENGKEVGESKSKSSYTTVSRWEYEGHMANTHIVIFGAVHETTTALLKRIGVLAPGYVGGDIPYRKYIFDLGRDRWVHIRFIVSSLLSLTLVMPGRCCIRACMEAREQDLDSVHVASGMKFLTRLDFCRSTI